MTRCLVAPCAAPRTACAGEVRLLSSGASPISPEVFDFMRICFGATGEDPGRAAQQIAMRQGPLLRLPALDVCSCCMRRPCHAGQGPVGHWSLPLPPVLRLPAVIEGYGLTETSCLVALTPPGDIMTGHVGPPSPACEVRRCS